MRQVTNNKKITRRFLNDDMTSLLLFVEIIVENNVLFVNKTTTMDTLTLTYLFGQVTTLSGNLSGFLLYILETREYCDVIKVLLHSKFSDHVTRA